MTLCISWLRNVSKDSKEYIVASDSRLSFSGATTRWDSCPKIFDLERGDSTIGFAGDTSYAYPLIQQTIRAINSNEKWSSRALDFISLKGQIQKIINSLLYALDVKEVFRNDFPEVKFLISGYSWKRGKYMSFVLIPNKRLRKFVFNQDGRHVFLKKRITMIGDLEKRAGEELSVIECFKNKLYLATKEHPNKGLGMEPLIVLRDMIRENKYESVGGPIQLFKLHPHMNVRPVCVFWPNIGSKRLTIHGRRMLTYEKPRYLSLDPDSLDMLAPKNAIEHLDISHEDGTNNYL